MVLVIVVVVVAVAVIAIVIVFPAVVVIIIIIVLFIFSPLGSALLVSSLFGFTHVAPLCRLMATAVGLVIQCKCNFYPNFGCFQQKTREILNTLLTGFDPGWGTLGHSGIKPTVAYTCT